jgi:hypothetical protein
MKPEGQNCPSGFSIMLQKNMALEDADISGKREKTGRMKPGFLQRQK